MTINKDDRDDKTHGTGKNEGQASRTERRDGSKNGK
jgi:hypothetical protein